MGIRRILLGNPGTLSNGATFATGMVAGALVKQGVDPEVAIRWATLLAQYRGWWEVDLE